MTNFCILFVGAIHESPAQDRFFSLKKKKSKPRKTNNIQFQFDFSIKVTAHRVKLNDPPRGMRLNFVKRGRRPPLLPTRFKYPYPSLSHPTSTADSDRATARSLFRVFYCPMISDLFCGVRIPQSGQLRGLSLRCVERCTDPVVAGFHARPSTVGFCTN